MLEHWQQAGWAFKTLRADLPVAGTVTADQTRLVLGNRAQISVEHMDAFEARQLMWLDDVVFSPGGAVLRWRDDQILVKGSMALSAGAVRYPGLTTQLWRAEADVRWQDTLTLNGHLGNEAGAELPFQARYQPAEGLDATINLALTAGNDTHPLAGTLADWPESLALDGGQVEATVRLHQPAGANAAISGEVAFDEASGLYRNMAWQGLSGTIDGHWRDGEVTVSTGALTLATLNPGIPIGPIQLQAEYRAAADNPAAGNLRMASASAGFAGGSLSLAQPVRWTMAEPPWRAPLAVKGVQLSELMNLYPTEGLAGEGTLAGQLPVRIDPAGVSIDNGRIHALPPGGRLQLPADKLAGMAQANAAMALVARAMEDFRYRVLESGIQYAEDGTLVLDLTLEGSSPQVDSDRPVVLNINLQEDIPALLTSLQLSGRVNEAIQERVRERLLQEDVDSQ